MRRLGLTAAVEFAGVVAETEVDAELARAACLATASEREGYGLVVVEAAAHGTPSVVVAGPENAAVDLVETGRNGAVAPSADPDAVAAALLDVLEAGAPLRASTSGWFEDNGPMLRIDRSLELVERRTHDHKTSGDGRPTRRRRSTGTRPQAPAQRRAERPDARGRLPHCHRGQLPLPRARRPGARERALRRARRAARRPHGRPPPFGAVQLAVSRRSRGNTRSATVRGGRVRVGVVPPRSRSRPCRLSRSRSASSSPSTPCSNIDSPATVALAARASRSPSSSLSRSASSRGPAIRRRRLPLRPALRTPPRSSSQPSRRSASGSAAPSTRPSPPGSSARRSRSRSSSSPCGAAPVGATRAGRSSATSARSSSGLIGIAVLTNVDVLVAKARLPPTTPATTRPRRRSRGSRSSCRRRSSPCCSRGTAARQARGEETEDILGASLLVGRRVLRLARRRATRSRAAGRSHIFGAEFAAGRRRPLAVRARDDALRARERARRLPPLAWRDPVRVAPGAAVPGADRRARARPRRARGAGLGQRRGRGGGVLLSTRSSSARACRRSGGGAPPGAGWAVTRGGGQRGRLVCSAAARVACVRDLAAREEPRLGVHGLDRRRRERPDLVALAPPAGGRLPPVRHDAPRPHRGAVRLRGVERASTSSGCCPTTRPTSRPPSWARWRRTTSSSSPGSRSRASPCTRSRGTSGARRLVAAWAGLALRRSSRRTWRGSSTRRSLHFEVLALALLAGASRRRQPTLRPLRCLRGRRRSPPGSRPGTSARWRRSAALRARGRGRGDPASRRVRLLAGGAAAVFAPPRRRDAVHARGRQCRGASASATRSISSCTASDPPSWSSRRSGTPLRRPPRRTSTRGTPTAPIHPETATTSGLLTVALALAGLAAAWRGRRRCPSASGRPGGLPTVALVGLAFATPSPVSASGRP